MTDASGGMCIIHFKSHKAYQVVKSAIDNETMALAAAFDSGFLIRKQVEPMFGQSIPLFMLTDTKCLFDVLTSNKNTTEVCLVLVVFASRQSSTRREIDNIGLIRSEDNLADDLSKAEGNSALLSAMRSSQLNHNVVDYILQGD